MVPPRFKIAVFVGVAVVSASLVVVSGAPRVDRATVVEEEGAIRLKVFGAGFGSSLRAMPIKADSFEAGEDGAALVGWQAEHAGRPGHYSSRRYHGGRSSARFSFPLGGGENGYIAGLDADELYVSYWVFIERVSGDLSRNVKLARVAASTPDGDMIHVEPNFGITVFDSTTRDSTKSYWLWYTNSLTGAEYGEASQYTERGWHRIEQWVKLSSAPGVSDGKRGFWCDRLKLAKPGEDSEHYVTLTPATPARRFSHLLLGTYVAHDPGGHYEIYYDDVYVARNVARVELCDTPTWPAGSVTAHCEVQTPLSWSDTEISLAANMGSFSGYEGLYAYVVDVVGAANGSGVQVSTSLTPPTAPGAVVVGKGGERNP